MERRAFGSPVKMLKHYLQNGQLPVALSFAAADAVVANSANAAAVNANSFDFIDCSFRSRSGPSATNSG
jgi:hypothetical protein